MNHTLSIIDGIYDIQPPASPPLNTGEWLFIFFICITLLITLYIIVCNTVYSRKNLTKRKIMQLQAAYLSGKINSHDAVYILSDLLRNGLCIKYPGLHTRLPENMASHRGRWNEFTRNLDLLRYREKSSENIEFKSVLAESLFWLKVWQ